jgi:branched-chain amino acid transport system substrate-binding protein
MKTNIFLAFLFSILLFSCKKDNNNSENVTFIEVAGLFSESGELSYLGVTSEAAIQIAIANINQDFCDKKIPYRFKFTAYDTQLNPETAEQALIQIAAHGCKLVIGPQTSSELLALQPIADSLGILVISPSSTSSSLAIPNDVVFRFSPGQAIVGSAMSQSYIDQGKQALIFISRNDAGSLGLQSAVVNHFTNSGGAASYAGIFNGTDTDFSAVLNNVKNEILNLSNNYSVNQIGVVTTSFDETLLLFEQASADPVLSSVNWFGGIGFFKNTNLLTSPAAAQFAVNTQFYSPGFSLPSAQQNNWEPLLNKIYARTGAQGDALTLCAYDAMNCLAKMIEDYQGVPKSTEALKSAFLNAAQNFSGITGPIELDANGDRANGTFDFYGLQNNNGSYQWTFVGQSE